MQNQGSYTDDPADDVGPVHAQTYRGNPDDEAHQRLFDDPEDVEPPKSKKRFSWICLGFLAVLLTAWIIWTVALGKLTKAFLSMEDEEHEFKRIDFEDIYNGTFAPQAPSLVWVENDPRDGIFTQRDPVTNDILLESIEDGKSTVYVKADDLVVGQGLLDVNSFELSQDAEYIMLRTNRTNQWRHSYYSNIYVYKNSDKSLFPLLNTSTVADRPTISYAAWSSTGHQMAYVKNNDLYITDLTTHRRVTFDGSPTVFNGVPDWVYEEEVFSSNFALWWSPDSSHLAYLRFNETAVPEFHMPLYTASDSSYPDELKIKYPKAGAANPLVSLHIYSLKSNQSVMVTRNSTEDAHIKVTSTHKDFEDDNRLITDVTWATTTNTHLLFKQMNRVQDHSITSLVTVSPDISKSTVTKAREYKPTDGGWIDTSQSMVFLADNSTQLKYMDIADDGKGFMHLGIFTASKPKDDPQWLTSGEWEVVDGSVVTDTKRKLVHFMSTERSSLERHLYTVELDNEDPLGSKKCLTCPENPNDYATYNTVFSPKFGYYLEYYLGPDVPTTTIKKIDNSTFSKVLENNTLLKNLLAEYELPRIRMNTVMSGGVDMNAMEILPPKFDITQRYPVLFHVYGGPGSQLVSHRFELSWQTFVASQLGYIIVTVDGRGTGFRGRDYRVSVRKRLGELETIDQVNAARHWATLGYVDPTRIAIWGWSYGGYMTTKVIEANDGVFSAGMAVAPVTDWRFYDSVYTERYMLTPELNEQGYIDSAVSNMTGFANAKYLLIHGTGDDNGRLKYK
ncbi:dipeptidyl peptidase IV N-terminal region-domain-containing protein [Phycomyces nitens]|nr:dipeptidyl peptidase IV N-terminal region-domain-containing protein [Phycomyces nitens]